MPGPRQSTLSRRPFFPTKLRLSRLAAPSEPHDTPDLRATDAHVAEHAIVQAFELPLRQPQPPSFGRCPIGGHEALQQGRPRR